MSHPPRPQPDPLAREVNRLLAQLEHGSPPRRDSDPVHDGAPRSSAPTVRPVITPRSSRAVDPATGESRRSVIALWGRVVLGVGFGAVMTQWPYSHECGLSLSGYLAAVGVVLLTGAWIAFESWKLRRGIPHILSLILFYWGLVLAAEQLLPRLGYAATTAGWSCVADPRPPSRSTPTS